LLSGMLRRQIRQRRRTSHGRNWCLSEIMGTLASVVRSAQVLTFDRLITTIDGARATGWISPNMPNDKITVSPKAIIVSFAHRVHITWISATIDATREYMLCASHWILLAGHYNITNREMQLWPK
jgi:hypothetical protein